MRGISKIFKYVIPYSYKSLLDNRRTEIRSSCFDTKDSRVQGVQQTSRYGAQLLTQRTRFRFPSSIIKSQYVFQLPVRLSLCKCVPVISSWCNNWRLNQGTYMPSSLHIGSLPCPNPTLVRWQKRSHYYQREVESGAVPVPIGVWYMATTTTSYARPVFLIGVLVFLFEPLSY